MCKIPSISSHIPRPSAGCNFSPSQFRLSVLPEAGNSARGQKLRLKPFWPNSPRRIFLRWNRSKNSGAGSFARFTLNYAWITSSFAWFFFNGKMQNDAKCCSIFLSSKSFARIGNFARRLLFFPTNCKKAFFGARMPLRHVPNVLRNS